MLLDGFFFDLDGTLTDSREGLFSSFRAGLAAVGAPGLADEALQGFLGTPLPELFRAVRPDVGPAEIEAGIGAFRAHYELYGIRQNSVYPGVVEALAHIQRLGLQTWIVTSKPQPHASRVIREFGLAPYVDGWVGAGLAETDTKTELVARGLRESGLAARRVMMVGDRFYDVVGALENGVAPVGALWGYGTRAELEAAGCRSFAASLGEFEAKFVPRFAAA